MFFRWKRHFVCRVRWIAGEVELSHARNLRPHLFDQRIRSPMNFEIGKRMPQSHSMMHRLTHQ
jgi:hypothetical protein